MIIGKESTYQEPVPHEPGQFIVFKYLTGVQMEMAENRKKGQSLEVFKEMPPHLVAAMMEGRRGQEQAEPDDPYETYDTALILWAGISAWSYAEAVTEDTVAAMDGKTRQWAYRHLIDKNTVTATEGEGSGS